MPLPPPPATAFTISGYPMAAAMAAASASVRDASSGSLVPGTTGTPARMAVSRAAVLLPIRRIASAEGPTNVRPDAYARLGEIVVLGEKPVAGMDGIGSGPARRGHDLVDGQVAVGRRAGSEMPRFVRVADVRSGAIAVRVHRHARNAQVAARARDADGNLTTVGDQELTHEEKGYGLQATGYGLQARDGLR